MAVTIKDLLDWFEEFKENGGEDHMLVGIDDGGLALEIVETGDWFEIGGLPDEED